MNPIRQDAIMVTMDINITYIIIVLVTVFVSMVLHEVMHGLVAYWLGDTTARDQGRLSLNPLRHIDPFLTIVLPIILAISGLPIFGGAKPVPFNPNRVRGGEWGVALVAISGPLTNFILAFTTAGLFVTLGAPAGSLTAQILITATFVNLGFFLFNMLPIPPLDGSRVLYALAPDFLRRAMEKMEQFGLLVILVIVLIASPLITTYISGAGIALWNMFMFIFGAR